MGAEVDVRAHLLWQRTHDVRDWCRRTDYRCAAQGQALRARRAGSARAPVGSCWYSPQIAESTSGWAAVFIHTIICDVWNERYYSTNVKDPVVCVVRSLCWCQANMSLKSGVLIQRVVLRCDRRSRARCSAW